MRVSTTVRRCLVLCAAGAFGLIGRPSTTFAQCQLQQLTPDMAQPDAQFGDCVAVDGDLAVVGASRANNSQGAVTVWQFMPGMDGEPGEWVETAVLIPAAVQSGDLFGWSVDLDADAAEGPVAVVGAYLDDEAGATNMGSVSVFRYNATLDVWVEEDKLTPIDGAAGDEYGRSVAISNDVLAIGSPRFEGPGQTNTGAVYVYRRVGQQWVADPTVTLPEADVADQDRFGNSVAIQELNGLEDVLVVGAALHDADGTMNAGAAYAYTYDGFVWQGPTKLTSDVPVMNGQFGVAVDVHGDCAVVGAFLEDAGAVYVFRNEGGWALETRLTVPEGVSGDQFGRAVRFSDDGSLLAVGAPLADPVGSSSGLAYLFEYEFDLWSAGERLAPLDGGAGDQFGWAVAVDEDHALIGSNRYDGETGLNEGSVAVFVTSITDVDDCNQNGTPDFCDIANGTSDDCNGNGLPDECEISVDTDVPGMTFYCTEDCDPDLNQNGIPDVCEDCNNNRTPDFQDIESGNSADCNANFIPDECDIDPTDPDNDGGVSEDIDDSGVPDECELDCNNNGMSDLEDILGGFSADCNMNGIPDECDIDADPAYTDCDGDGVIDQCQFDPSIDDDPRDCNNNGVYDACEDCDGNGIADECDIADGADDCNSNGVPDQCEDCDLNGQADACDILEAAQNGIDLDINENGILDICESDCNDNHLPDVIEVTLFPELDCNANFIPDECEIDEDTPPIVGGPYFCEEDCDPDCNLNGIPDECDIASLMSEDCDANGIPDECQPDCDENGVRDACEILANPNLDLNGNGVLDTCEDCNENGVPDSIDLDSGVSSDCNANEIPDECEIDAASPAPGGPFFCVTDCGLDCDDNGILDECDLAAGTHPDFNNNGVPDLCDPDCDANGFPDFIDILFLGAEDCDLDGVPDFCQIDVMSTAPGGPFFCLEDCDLDINGNGVPDACDDIMVDQNGDGVINFDDLSFILAAWGPCASPCPEDIDGSGEVDFDDLAYILAGWS